MKFLIFSDDLTGAYDIAVNGRAYKRPMKVIWKKEDISLVDNDLVFCTETRDKDRGEAEKILREISVITKECCNFTSIYMKVDSMLRGNIIAEVKAIDSIYDFDYIIIDVAYPQIGRTVEEGEVLINGVKIQNTDVICDINAPADSNIFLNDLKKAFDGRVQCLKCYEDIGEEKKVLFFDTVREEEFIHIIKKINNKKARVLWVGSIGLYTALLSTYYEKRKVFCVIGSVSDISKQQILKAQRETTSLVKIDANNEQVSYYVQQILSLLRLGKDVILFSERVQGQKNTETDAVINKIYTRISDIAYEVIKKEKGINIVVSGGETAMSLLSKKDIVDISVVGEIEKSVPILEIKSESFNYAVAIKSGRVGDEQALVRYIEFMRMYTIV